MGAAVLVVSLAAAGTTSVAIVVSPVVTGTGAVSVGALADVLDVAEGVAAGVGAAAAAFGAFGCKKSSLISRGRIALSRLVSPLKP